MGLSKTNDAELKKILDKYTKIAVIGLSPVPGRPSYGVTRYMINNGYEVFGVRPGSPAKVMGRPNVSTIAELPPGIEIINVFRNPDAIPDVVEEIEAWMRTLSIEHRPKVLWLQLGISNPAAEAKAASLGLKVVSNLCIMVEHSRLNEKT